MASVLPKREAAGGLGLPLLSWLWLSLFAIAFAPTVAWMWDRWTIDIWQSGHGLMMPFVLTYLTWNALRQSKVVGPQSSPLGFAFLAVGLGMLLIDQPIRTEVLAAAGLVVCLPGLSLLLLGFERTRELLFPLAISPLLIPFPAGAVSLVQTGMMQVSAIGATWILDTLAQVPTARIGLYVYAGPGTFEVAPQCSGMNTLFVGLTLSVLLAYFSPRPWKRILLLAIAAPLVIACNSLRVAVLIVLSNEYGHESILGTWVHETTGIASFAIVFLVLGLIAGREVAASRN